MIFMLIIIHSAMFSQKFMIFDIDTTKLPLITANYLILDSENKVVEDVSFSDFSIKMKDEDFKIKDLTPPKRSTKLQKASIILTIDVSGSMSGENIEMAKQAAITFINLTPLYSCEIAISTFDNGNFLNLDFYKNKDKLIDAVSKINAIGGTDYDKGLLVKPAGALEIMQNAQYEKKVVIFLTDGLGTGNSNSIISNAKNQEVAIYPITVNMPMPSVLEIIAKGTNGECFPNVFSNEQALNVYTKILNKIMETEFGKISWEIKPVCQASYDGFDIQYKNVKYFMPFTYPQKMLIQLNPSSDLIDFGSVEVGDTAVNKITYTAKNDNFTITEIVSKNPDVFQIIPPVALPLTIANGKKTEFIVKFIPKDSLYINDKITLVSDKCKVKNVYLYGGTPNNDPFNNNLILTYPNGGEKLGISSFSNATWEGVSQYDSILVAISVDGGKSYQYLGSGANFEFGFSVPGTRSDSCLMRITHNLTSYLQYESKLTKSSNNVEIFSDNKTIFVSGRSFAGSLNMTKSIFNGVITPDYQIYSVELSPNQQEFAEISNDKIIFRNTNSFIVSNQIKNKNFLGITFKKIHKKPITDVAYSNDGNFFATASTDGEVKIWDISSGKTAFKINTDINYLDEIGYIADTNLFYIIDDYDLFFYDINNYKNVYHKEIKNKITDVIFYENAQKVIILNNENNIKIYNTKDWSLEQEVNLNNSKIDKIELDPTYERLGVLHNNSISMYNFPDFVYLFDIEYNRRINDFTFNSDGTRIIASAGNYIPVWSAYKRVKQTDVSDDFFSIEGGLPDAKPVVMDPGYVSYNTSEYVIDFLTNQNGYPIEIKKIEFEGKNSDKFGLVSGFPPFKIAPYSGKNVEFSYYSNETTIDSAQILIILHTDTIKTTIIAQAKPIPFEVKNTYIDFGTLKKDEQKRLQVPILKNTSSEAIKIAKVYIVGGEQGQFELHTKLENKILNPDESLVFDATYNAIVPRRTTMGVIFAFEGASNPISVTLMGNCFVPRSVQLSGIVTDALTGKPIEATINVLDIVEDTIFIGAAKTNKSGKYLTNLSYDRKYCVQAKTTGYSTSDTIIDLTEFSSLDKMKKNFILEPDFSMTDVVVLNLFFDTDKYSLKDIDKQKMSGIIAYLKKKSKTEN